MLSIEDSIEALTELVSRSMKMIQQLLDENAAMRQDIVEIRKDIVEIRTDIQSMRHDIQHLTTRVSALEQQQKRQSERLSLIDDHISRNYNHIVLTEQSQLLVEKRLNRLEERVFDAPPPDTMFSKAA
jgi:septal ring factor EnvC (AmiA/AmiB activator)